jgi:HSP20 family protein
MSEKRTFEKGVADSKEIVDKGLEKGKNVAGRVATDFGKTMDDIMLNLKSFQKDVDSKINEYKETAPTKIDLDLIDAGDSIYVKADLPGVKKEDIDIEIVEKELTIRSYFGSSCKDNEGDCDNANCEFLIKGRKYGPAKRTVTLPNKIKTNEAKAEFTDGVLFLELPKVEIKKLKVNIE